MKLSLSTLVLAVVALGQPAKAESYASFRQRLAISDTEIDRKAPMPSSYADILESARPAVVSISSDKIVRRRTNDVWDQLLREYYGLQQDPRGGGEGAFQRQQQGLGSGILITRDGYIITNNHVIDGADEITVTLPDPKQHFKARLIATDPSSDVALIKIDGKEFPRATLGDSGKLRVGDVVLAIGNPFELDQTVTKGIVSALGRSNVSAGKLNYANFIQTDAPINPGNSGGALVDSQGRLIGINTMIYSNTGASMGIGFAIPINMALKVVGSLLDHGEVTRGYLGVELGAVDDNTARRSGRRDLAGALVRAVVPQSPADQAGLRAGDVIVEFDGQSIMDYSKLRLAVSNSDPGANVTFGVMRGGKMVDMPVRLGKRHENGGQDTGGYAAVPRPKVPRPLPLPEDEDNPPTAGDVATDTPYYLEGLALSPLDAAARERLGLDDSVTGTLVSKAEAESTAGQAGLRAGDVIVEIGRMPVKGVQDAYNTGAKIRGNSVVLGVIRDGREEFIMVKRR